VNAAELKARIDEELAEDREFLRKLRPSLIAARARSRNPTAAAPRAAQLPARGDGLGPAPAGPNPFLVIGVALVLGVALAKVIDWRGHAHPRW